MIPIEEPEQEYAEINKLGEELPETTSDMKLVSRKRDKIKEPKKIVITEENPKKLEEIKDEEEEYVYPGAGPMPPKKYTSEKDNPPMAGNKGWEKKLIQRNELPSHMVRQ